MLRTFKHLARNTFVFLSIFSFRVLAPPLPVPLPVLSNPCDLLVAAAAGVPARAATPAPAGRQAIRNETRTLEALVHNYLNRPPISTRRQNAAFRRMYSRADHDTKAIVTILFPLVSTLNKELTNKERTASLFNLYKEILKELIDADPILRDKIRYIREESQLQYADYKIIGMGFTEENQALFERLDRIRELANEEFWRVTHQIPELRALDDSGQNMLQNRRAWFHWGYGRTGLEAWSTSRVGRDVTPTTGHLPIQRYDSPSTQRILNQRLDETEQIRRRVTRVLLELHRKGAKDMISRLNPDHHWVPSARLWDIIRNVVAANEAEYIAEIQRRIKVVFKVDVSEQFVRDLQAYQRGLDLLQPMVFQRKEQMSLGISHSTNPIFYFDVRGQTGRNTFRSAAEIARIANSDDTSGGSRVDRVIRALFEGQQSESRIFERIKRRLRYVFRMSGVRGSWLESGDEMAFQLEERLTPNQVKGLLLTLGEEGVFGHYRPVLLVPGDGVAPTGTHVVDGETIEKNLRWRLYGSNRFRPSDWDNLMIGIEVRPTARGGDVRVYLIEKPGSRVNQRIVPWVRRLLTNPTSAAQILPPGYTFQGLHTSISQ